MAAGLKNVSWLQSPPFHAWWASASQTSHGPPGCVCQGHLGMPPGTILHPKLDTRARGCLSLHYVTASPPWAPQPLLPPFIFFHCHANNNKPSSPTPILGSEAVKTHGQGKGFTVYFQICRKEYMGFSVHTPCFLPCCLFLIYFWPGFSNSSTFAFIISHCLWVQHDMICFFNRAVSVIVLLLSVIRFCTLDSFVRLCLCQGLLLLSLSLLVKVLMIF